MAKNRAAAEAFIIKYINKLAPVKGGDNANAKMYKEWFAGMSDQQFDDLMAKLKTRAARLPFIAPNQSAERLSVERNLALADELKHSFFERIWLDDGDGSPPYLSPIKYLIVDLPLRRQAQFLQKKISIPEDNRSVDDLTGQPTGKSKGSRISYPELQVLSAIGMDKCLTELMKYRGGDVKGFDAMNASITATGGASIEALNNLGTEVKSTRTLSAYLTAMHLGNTL